MKTITICTTYQPENIQGVGMEQLDNIIIPLSQFISDMQALGCEVTMSINGQDYPLPQPAPVQEQAS